jgi:chromosomal replication initiator protein
MKTQELFKKFLEEVAKDVSPSTYTVWFSHLELISIEDNVMTIKVPLPVCKKLFKEEYYDLFDETMFSLTGINYTFNFVTEDELEELIPQTDETPNNKTIDNEQTITWNTNLNKNLNFDNYVVGESNRLAFISAINVAQSPGTIRNPLFIYGRSGIGKTHLMHAIGNYITEHSDKKVLYTTSEVFKEEYAGISNMEKGSASLEYANNFKNKYRNVDVLIIDDIQFLVGAEKTQNEFFHTFEALHQANKQIIISSDRSPDDLKKIEERLRSRFTWGLPVDIYPPDFELRCDIIKQKLSNTSIKDKVNKDVIEYIANACPNDVRHIEGTINRLLAYTAIYAPKEINLDFAIEAIKDYVNINVYQDNTISHIQKVVADYFKITVEDLKSKKRSNNIARPRHIAMYLCRIETDENLAKIGLEFGGRDHSTVVASFEKVKNDLKENPSFEQVLKDIKSKL